MFKRLTAHFEFRGTGGPPESLLPVENHGRAAQATSNYMTVLARSLILAVLLIAPCFAADAPAKETDQIDPLMLAAIDAATRGDLKPLAEEVEPRAGAVVADAAKLDTPALLQIATAREFAKYFGRVGELSNPNRTLLAWLIAQPKLAPTLMMAVSPEDPPDGLLDALRRLHDDYGDDLTKNPDLVAAFCTVWDSTGDIEETDPKKVDLDRVSRLYSYYTKSSPRFDVKELPWQLATWMVSNPLTEDEIKWARGKYLEKGALAETFFDPPYNEYPDLVKEPKKPTDVPYLLPNILKGGGRAVDRAYYAVAISRSLGVPAGVCTATLPGDDQYHLPAWAAVLEVNNRRVRWNFESARLPEHRGWHGTVMDPQSHSLMLDTELAQLAELQAVSLDRRLASVAICKLLDAADEVRRPDLLLKAIELSPGNVRAWQSLNEMVVKRKLSDEQTELFTSAIEKYALPHNGAFAFDMFMALVKPRGTIQQLALLDRAAKGFAGQPDVLARVKLMQGDCHRDMKHPDLAMAAFGDAITLQPKSGPLVLDAFQRIDAMLRKNNDLPRLIDAYAAEWPRLDRPRPSKYSRSVPYLLLGKMYIQALEDGNRKNDAKKIQAAIESVQMDP